MSLPIPHYIHLVFSELSSKPSAGTERWHISMLRFRYLLYLFRAVLDFVQAMAVMSFALSRNRGLAVQHMH